MSGYPSWGALVFCVLQAIVAATYDWARISTTLLFWAAFVLTRPLVATVGYFLDRPLSAGGLELGRHF